MAASYTKERLDRAVANSLWRAKFPLVKVINGDPRHSNHRPNIVEVGKSEGKFDGSPMQNLKKFEAQWLEEECTGRVVQAWSNAMDKGVSCVMEIQKKVLQELWEWDRNVLGELEKHISKVKELERCRRRSISQEQVNWEYLLRCKLERLEDQLNIYWKQRAHTTWLLQGDRNTKFFHAYSLHTGKECHLWQHLVYQGVIN